MAFDPQLADRIRSALAGTPGLVEKKLFGGLGFLVNGNMAVGAESKGGLIVRCAVEDHADLLEEPNTRPLEDRMRGWIVVDAHAVEEDAALLVWVERGRAFAESLPPK